LPMISQLGLPLQENQERGRGDMMTT
jgi:hypothetical protein